MRAKRWAVALISTALVAAACGGGDAGDDDFQARLAELNAASAAAAEAEADVEVVEASTDPTGARSNDDEADAARDVVGLPDTARLDEDELTAATMTLLPEDLDSDYPGASLRPTGTAVVDVVSIDDVGTNDAWAELSRTARLAGYRTELHVPGTGTVRTEVHLMRDEAAAQEWLGHWVDLRTQPQPAPLGYSTTEVAGLPGDGSLYRWVETSEFLAPRVWRETAFASDAVVAIVTVDREAPAGTTSAEADDLDADTLWFAKRLAERVYGTSSGSIPHRDPEPAGYYSVADVSDRYTVHIEVTFAAGESTETWRLRATRFGEDYQCQLVVDDGITEALRTDVRVAHATGYIYDASASNFAQTTVGQVGPLLSDCRLGSAAVVGYSFEDRELLTSRPAVAPSGPVTRYSTTDHATFAAASGIEMPDGVELLAYSEEIHPDGWVTRVNERWTMPGDFVEALFIGYGASGAAIEVRYDYRVVAVDDDVVAPDGPIPLGDAVELTVGQTLTEVETPESDDGSDAGTESEQPAEEG